MKTNGNTEQPNNVDDEEGKKPEEAIEEAPAPEEPKAPEVDFKTKLRIKDLEGKVASYEAKISEVRDYVRKMENEIQEIRTRTERDLQKNSDKQAAEFFHDILPVVDNFERSLRAAIDKKESGAFIDGVRMIHQQLEDLFKKSGLKKIPTKGEIFNPVLHEALTTAPVDDENQDDRVLEEVKAGYKYKDTVVRPAQVIVGKLIQ
ncbi:MAG: nucleotide exchange factor GrpE [Bacteriovoracaceae bacterium]|nr:nucleotide exchange factor GrpE [Bacteriovoracaceae bacterium]